MQSRSGVLPAKYNKKDKKLSHIFFQAITQWRFTPSGVQDKGRKNLVVYSFKQSRNGVLPPAEYKIGDEKTWRFTPSGVQDKGRKNLVTFSSKQSPSGVSTQVEY